MPSPWINHIKMCANKFGLTYPQAMKDPRTRDSYYKMKGGKISRITKAEKWTNYAYDTAKKGIHLGVKGAKGYSKASRALAKSV
jgi:hypothetical protein